MKRFVIPTCLALAVAACDSGETTTTATATTVNRPQTATGRQALGARTTQPKRDPLDFVGRYLAATPSKDEPIAVDLFENASFRAVPRVGPSIEGTFSWDITGSVVTLMSNDELVGTFFVGEGFLRRTDAGKYEGVILRKPPPPPRQAPKSRAER